MVQTWLDGRSGPTIETLPAIAKQLDMSVAQLGLLYLMDSSEVLDLAVRDDLRRLGIWEEVSSARAMELSSTDRDFSVSDPHDEPEVDAKLDAERTVIKAGIGVS